MYVDGMRVNTSAEPFIYNGTTYLPVRAAGEALGENVHWDGSTKSVYIGERPGAVDYLMEVCPPYQKTHDVKEYYANDGDSFLMAGNKYSNGIVGWCYNTGVYFNTNSQYRSMQFTYGPQDEKNFPDAGCTVSFIGDGRVLAAYDVHYGDLPKTASISLNGVNQLVIQFSGGTGNIGVGNITVQ